MDKKIRRELEREIFLIEYNKLTNLSMFIFKGFFLLFFAIIGYCIVHLYRNNSFKELISKSLENIILSGSLIYILIFLFFIFYIFTYISLYENKEVFTRNLNFKKIIISSQIILFMLFYISLCYLFFYFTKINLEEYNKIRALIFVIFYIVVLYFGDINKSMKSFIFGIVMSCVFFISFYHSFTSILILCITIILFHFIFSFIMLFKKFFERAYKKLEKALNEVYHK